MSQPDRERSRRAGQHAARTELRRVRAGLERIDSLLNSLETPPTPSRSRNRPERYYLLLVDVYERGRRGVDTERFAALGRRRGYDARGLGGFFIGDRAALRRTDQHVTLTTEGHRLVTSFLSGHAS